MANYISKFTGEEIDNTLTNKTISESGSNENGSWIKWADGTMICYARISKSRASEIAWGRLSFSIGGDSFPQTFISVPSVNVTLEMLNSTGGGHIITGYDLATSSRIAHFYVRTQEVSGSKTETINYNYIAIGRWK